MNLQTCSPPWSVVTEESLKHLSPLKENPLNGEKVKGLQPLLGLDKHEIGPDTRVQVKSMQTQFKIMKWAVSKCPSYRTEGYG